MRVQSSGDVSVGEWLTGLFKSEYDIGRIAFGVLIITAILQVILQLNFFISLGPDDAQLVLWAQEFRIGVRDQPTMLSNIAWALWQLGIDPMSFMIFTRQFFVVSAILLLRDAFKYYGFDNVLCWIGAFAIVLLPDIHRNGLTILTHSSFMIFSLALTFRGFVSCLKNPNSILSYCLFGVSAAFLFHSKYNATLFFLLLFVLTAFDRTTRQVMFDRKIFVSLFLFLLALLPVVLWTSSNGGDIAATQSKYSFGAGGDGFAGPAYGALKLFEAIADSLKYVLVFGLIGFFMRDKAKAKEDHKLITTLIKYSFLFVAIALMAAMITEVGEVKRRWLIPGLYFVAIATLLWVSHKINEEKRQIYFLILCVFWIGSNSIETYDALSINKKKPSQVRTDHRALAKYMDAHVRTGDFIVGTKQGVAEIIWRRKDLVGWAGEIPWPVSNKTKKDAQLFLIWAGRLDFEHKVLARLKSELGEGFKLEYLDRVPLNQEAYPEDKRGYHVYKIAY